MIMMVDMMVVLDALKDMKAGLLNDFSRYKRAFQPIRTEITDGEKINTENQDLHMFLSNPQQPHNLIMHNLKLEIQKVKDYDSVLVRLVFALFSFSCFLFLAFCCFCVCVCVFAFCLLVVFACLLLGVFLLPCFSCSVSNSLSLFLFSFLFFSPLLFSSLLFSSLLLSLALFCRLLSTISV
jgi:hypothetical protein